MTVPKVKPSPLCCPEAAGTQLSLVLAAASPAHSLSFPPPTPNIPRFMPQESIRASGRPDQTRGTSPVIFSTCYSHPWLTPVCVHSEPPAAPISPGLFAVGSLPQQVLALLANLCTPEFPFAPGNNYKGTRVVTSTSEAAPHITSPPREVSPLPIATCPSAGC